MSFVSKLLDVLEKTFVIFDIYDLDIVNLYKFDINVSFFKFSYA